MNARNLVLSMAATLAGASTLPAQTTEPKVGDRIAVFEMKRERRSDQDVSRLSAAVAEVLSGAKLQAAPEVKPAPRARGEHRRLRVTVPEGPPLRIRYLPETDELRALNIEVAADTRPAKDVGQPAAVDLARRAVRQLAAAGVVDARHFDLATPDVASTWVGEGSVDGRVREVRRRVEYRVTWRRRLNGIDFANAGVRVAVHASGRLAGLRIGGVGVVAEPNGAADEPKGGGRWLERTVDSADIARRFRKDASPDGVTPDVAYARVMYVMPEGKSEAVVEPLYVYSYSLKFKTDAREPAVSRRKVLGYSLIDPAAPPVDLVPPVRKPREGDAKPPAS